MKSLIILASFGLFLMTLSVAKVYAQSNNNAGVSINKTVLNPQTLEYVKNLSLGSALYHPSDEVVFHISLNNSGSKIIQQLIVKDELPQYTTFVSGPGSLDQKNNTLSFLVYNLKPNTSQTFAIIIKVKDKNQFMSTQPEVCLSNKADAVFGSNQTIQDSSQFCISNTISTSSDMQQTTKGGQKIFAPTQTSTTPSTGSESYLIPMFLSFGLFGTLLRCSSRFKFT